MIEHIVLFKFTAATTAEEKTNLVSRLKKLSAVDDGIIQIKLRADILRTEDSFDIGMFLTLADRASLRRYGESSERQAVSEYARSLCDQVALFDYETDKESSP